jgi:beta-lactamase superfamily II metal-dependent hydrolase
MTMSVFRLAMHPASEGDALMMTWGDTAGPRHALVDLGRTKNYRALRPLLQEIAVVDLFAITHIDADHIEGAVPLFKEQQPPLKARDVWFNGYVHLETANERLPPDARVTLGAGQAEKVTAGIIKSGWPWNAHFGGGVVSIDSAEAKAPIIFADGLSVTLLAPTDRKLAELLPVWADELKAAGLRTTDPDEVAEALAQGRVHLGGLNVEDLTKAKFKEDVTKPNGASIVFIAEYCGKRVLMGADAQPGVVESSLRAVGASKLSPYRLDCLKVSHHGSKANTSPELLEILDCTCFAFSTDGSRHGHPDPETIARILKSDPGRKKTLIFNFRQDSTDRWDDADLMARWNYECIFPKRGREGIEIDLYPTIQARS